MSGQEPRSERGRACEALANALLQLCQRLLVSTSSVAQGSCLEAEADRVLQFVAVHATSDPLGCNSGTATTRTPPRQRIPAAAVRD
jgi:hypothetical protein